MARLDNSEELSRRLVYLAAERTLTSWIRTAISLMALGFVVDRFDLVVREMLDAPLRAALHAHAVWRWSGSVLIGIGIMMAMAAGAYYLRFAMRYRRDGSTEVGRSMIFGALFTVALGVGGVIVLVVITSALK
jgi:putative membrane protein